MRGSRSLRIAGAAILLSSGLFGLWHVVPSLGGGTANATMASVVGADAAGTVVRVVVAVVFPSLAGGVVLCALRLRSGSLVAPVLAHWTGQRSGCDRDVGCLGATWM